MRHLQITDESLRNTVEFSERNITKTFFTENNFILPAWAQWANNPKAQL